MSIAALLCWMPGTACAPPKVQTSFLRSVDLVDMTTIMAQSFARTPVIAQRSPDSPRWIISVDKVVNNTNQIIPENEKWAYIGRLRAQLAQTRISQEKNLVWVVPPERWPEIAREIDAAVEPRDLRLPPTHLLTATFSALTTTTGQGRTDAYFCAFQLIDLNSGTLVWEDAWEVKRGVLGRTWD